MPMRAPQSLTLRATSAHFLERMIRVRLPHPQIFSTSTVTPTPRRPAVYS